MCLYVWGPFRGKDSTHGDWPDRLWSGPVDCSDWTHVGSAVDFSPGGVRIGYIRGELWDRYSTDAAPVRVTCLL